MKDREGSASFTAFEPPPMLFETLTALSHPPEPATSLVVELLKTLARTVYRARRNAQLLYRITAKVRDLCDHLNGILEALEDQDDDEAVLAFDSFLIKLESLEQ